MKYYSVTAKSEKFKHDWLDQNCKKGLKVLDFACGSGENGICRNLWSTCYWN